MSGSIDSRGVEFMRLEALLKEAAEAQSEMCWHRAMREVTNSLAADKINDDDVQILKDDYPSPQVSNVTHFHGVEEVYFFKKSEIEFTKYIDDLVEGFNAVAQNEGQNMSSRTFMLKKMFDRMTDLAITEITNAVHNTAHIEQAVSRTHHVLDIMMDDANDYAPELVKRDILDKALNDPTHEWHALAVHRGENADHLRTMLEAFYETESVMRKQGMSPQDPSAENSGQVFVPQLAEALPRRTVPSPIA